jgi:protein involved in polysaccharide export with SLBB domain
VKAAITMGLRRVRKEFEVSVQLKRLRKIKVEVTGEVVKPGTVILGPLTRAAEAVSRAGGLTEIASWRHVRVRRGDQTLPEVDLEQIWRYGNSETNIALETGDQLFVPRAQGIVTVEGEVNRPGAYEFDPGESVKEVVRRAGGVRSTGAETAVHVERPGTGDRRVLVPADLTQNPPPVILSDRDTIVVPPLTAVQGRVRIVGAVKGSGANWVGDTVAKEGSEGINSGLYLLRQGDRVRDVIENVGGLTAKADRTKAQIERPDGAGGKQVLPVDLYRLLVQHDESQNLELRDGDTFVVPRLLDQVFVLGQVLQPGPVQYEEGRTILHYVSVAKGSGHRARKSKTTLVRGDLPEPEMIRVPLDRMMAGKVDPRSIVVKPGDIIVVPSAKVRSWGDVAGIVLTVRGLFGGF